MEFSDENDARDAIENMHNSELFGKVIRVSYARPAKASSKAAWADPEEWLATLKPTGDRDAAGAGVAPIVKGPSRS